MSKYVIYGLICPMLDTVVYVGQSRNYSMRMRQHRCHGLGKSKNYRYEAWKEVLGLMGLRPKGIILEETTEELRNEREKYWISKYSEDTTLMNLITDKESTGPGHFSRKIKGKTFEQMYSKERAAIIRKQVSLPKERNPNWGGAVCTPEWREKQSVSNSKVPIVALDRDGNTVGIYTNSRICAESLGIRRKSIRLYKNKNWHVARKYRIRDYDSKIDGELKPM